MGANERTYSYRKAFHGNCCDYFGRGGRYPYEVEEAEGRSRGAGPVRSCAGSWTRPRRRAPHRVVTVVGHMRDQVEPFGGRRHRGRRARRRSAARPTRRWPSADALAGFDGAACGALRRLPAHSARDHSPAWRLCAKSTTRPSSCSPWSLKTPSATVASCATAPGRWPASSSRRTRAPRKRPSPSATPASTASTPAPFSTRFPR